MIDSQPEPHAHSTLEPQFFQTSKIEILAVPGDVRLQTQVGIALAQAAHDNARFEAGQWRTHTKMRARSKGHVLIVHARHVEPVGLRKLGRVAIRRTEDQIDDLTLLDVRTGDGQIFFRQSIC